MPLGKKDLNDAINKAEKEKDAPDDGRPRQQASAGFLVHDTTLNVMMPVGGQVLMSLSDPSFHQLLAGARANVGLTSGRHIFEVAILECRSSSSAEPLVRFGFAHASAHVPLLDTEDEGMACFDWEGHFSCDGQRKRVTQRFQRGDVAAIVLNLDKDSPNAFTASLFRNGVRASAPQSLPEALHSQALFPAVSFVGATLRVNLDGPFLRPPPFRCLSVQEAALEDCKVTEAAAALQDGKHEILLPVGLPDEGIWKWIDRFLEDHKDYYELSRKIILQWAARSGVWVKAEGSHGHDGQRNGNLNSQEHQPLQLDEAKIPELVEAFSPLGLRNFLVSEVIENLTAAGRKAALDRFSSTEYRKIAIVVIGEPSEAYKEKMKGLPSQEESREPRETEDFSRQFTSFSLPDSTEGFDEIRFEWQPLKECEEHLQKWKQRCKLTQRIEDLQPSKWFSKKWSEWQKVHSGWKRAQSEWKEVIKVLDQWKDEGSKQDADEGKEEKREKAKDERPTETIAEDLEVFSVKDVNDIGEGEPLFSNFEYEDWCVLSLRFELHLLAHAFRRDVGDPERTCFHTKHLEFYYTLYYKKALKMNEYGVPSAEKLVQMVEDSVEFDASSSTMRSKLDENTPMDKFMKLAEADRRDRARRLDAGDEIASLNIPKPAETQPARKAQKAAQQPSPGSAESASQGGAASRRPAPRIPAPRLPATQAPGRAPAASGTKRPIATMTMSSKQARSSGSQSHGSSYRGSRGY
mmetsp:Transcript_63019/g.114517  ORF Transcript_63019/g.114517 Transcript_63019/m.114517 type:complete len:747 (+) Transcript_63019:15-2255(+)